MKWTSIKPKMDNMPIDIWDYASVYLNRPLFRKFLVALDKVIVVHEAK